MKKIKRILIMGGLLSSVCLADQAMAVCSYSIGSAEESLGSQVIPPLDVSGPIGTVLYSGTLLPQINNFKVSCDSSIGNTAISTDYTYLGANTFDTGIPGIGFKFVNNYTSVDGMPTGTYLTPTGYQGSMTSGVITLVKTGPTSTGGYMKTGILAAVNIPGHSNFLMRRTRVTIPILITIVNPTCSAAVSSVNVDLGSVDLQELSVTGRSTPQNFSLDLLCSGGDGTTTTDVYVTLTDQSNASNRSTELSLTPGSTATGVALEINNKNGLVSFGADSDAPGNPGQWFEGAANNGAFSIPLSANYVKTATSPTPGSANAVATYTISYQ